MHYTDRCSLCPRVNTPLPPDGPDDSDILFIGEASTRDDEKRKRVMTGRTGDEVNQHYLPLAGLQRGNVRFTNAIACLPATSGGKLDPTNKRDVALLESCTAAHLYPLIERGRFQCLVPLGSFACRATVPGLDLELQHGRPLDSPWGIPAFPMYHPALGLYEPKKMLHIRTDWHRLRSYLNGTLTIAQDAYPEPDYQEATDDDIHELDGSKALAGDTESQRDGTPFCLTFTQRAGRGRLIRASSSHHLRAFNQRLQTFRAPILFHNWLYDSPVTERLGLSFRHDLLVDTMQRIFHLGNLPQGLKALAFRELGMEMEDFTDVVGPYSRQRVLDYYQDAQTHDWPKPPEELVQDGKTGKWKMYRPQGMNTKLKRFFTDVSKNPNKDVFGMWENWSSPAIEEACGPYPGMCISHVPFYKVLYYACRDADATLRLWSVIQKMEKNVRKYSQENWLKK